MAGYHSVKDILTICSDEKLPIWKVIMEEDCVERQVVQSESFAGMRAMYTAMKQADKSYDSRRRSASGLAGGDGEKLHIYNMSDKKLCSDFTSLAIGTKKVITQWKRQLRWGNPMHACGV